VSTDTGTTGADTPASPASPAIPVTPAAASAQRRRALVPPLLRDAVFRR
jgi:hypothetical protein